MQRKVIEGKHLGPMMMLPAKPGTCEQCATAHDPSHAHNAQSLFYQYYFYNQHGRWPTWIDATEHCSDEMKSFWRQQLTELKVDVDGGQISPGGPTPLRKKTKKSGKRAAQKGTSKDG